MRSTTNGFGLLTAIVLLIASTGALGAPAAPSGLGDARAFRPGDTFSKCYATMCVTIDQIGAPGQQVQFSLTVTPL